MLFPLSLGNYILPQALCGILTIDMDEDWVVCVKFSGLLSQIWSIRFFWLLCHSCAETVLLAKSALRSILQIRTKEITYLLLIKRRLNSSFHMMQSHLSSKSTQELYFTSFFYILCDGKRSPFQNASCSLTYQISLLLCIVYWCRPFFWDAV